MSAPPHTSSPYRDRGNLLHRHLKVASPCSLMWDDLPGDDRVRACSRCSQSVFTLDALSSIEAGELLRAEGAPSCKKLFRRADGAVMTVDCPERAVRRASVAGAIAIAAIAAAIGVRFIALQATWTGGMPSDQDTAGFGAENVQAAAELHLARSEEFHCPTLDELVEHAAIPAQRTRDPWGSPYVIECSGHEIRGLSNGPDRQLGTPDDIAGPDRQR